MFHPIKWFKDLHQRTPIIAKLVIPSLLFIIIVGGGYGTFKFYDFTENNPKFCVSCHLMEPAFAAWEKSEHKNINCHDCHELGIIDKNKLLISFVLHRPESVPQRHGKIIVPWKLCMKCHWETNEAYPDAPRINHSQYHAKHVFMEQVECSKCHGYRTHKFTLEERYCTTCHGGKEVHGIGMEKLACLNCHTDLTTDLLPARKKCLFCHGNESVRKELIDSGTIDVTHFQPLQDVIEKAKKINVPADAPMQFFCYECHKPHAKIKPDWGDCLLKCHSDQLYVGKHEMHVKTMGIKCVECHKPHSWRVTEAQAKEDCARCHEYRPPNAFIGP